MMERISINTRTIQAGRARVFEAFTGKEALEHWMAPYGMTGKVHRMDMKVGGGYEMSLYYNDATIAGKTSANEDRFSATFVDIKPNESLVQAIHFHSEDNISKEAMIMEVLLEERDNNSTHVTIIFKNIPEEIDPKDNEDGTAQSLEKLAQYLENN